MTKGLSKSRYTAFCQCPKLLWLRVNEPDEATPNPALEARFKQGNEVGDLAMGLFGPYKEVTTKNPDGRLLLPRHPGYGENLGETEGNGEISGF